MRRKLLPTGRIGRTQIAGSLIRGLGHDRAGKDAPTKDGKE